MAYWLTINEGYYGGDQQDPSDIEVPRRPEPDGNLYMYDRLNLEWIINPAKLLARDKEKAIQDLVKTDSVAIRAIKDNILWPQEWKNYDNELRFIVNASNIDDYDNTYPTMPSYPVFDPNVPNLTLINDLTETTQKENPISGATVQLAQTSANGILALMLSGDIAELTIMMPPNSVARKNMVRKIGASHNIAKVNYVPFTGDTTLITEAPSMINKNEVYQLQMTEPGVWVLIGSV